MSANIAANSMTRNERSMSSTMERLSTGLRINSAKDDAAGLAISSKMTSQIRGLNQAVRNANDAISMVQVAEGAMKEVTNMFQRMRELAVQSISDSNTNADRTALNNEYKQLSQEVQRIGENTQWNGTNILDGARTNTVFQIGANANQTISVNFGDLSGNDTTAAITSNTVLTLNEAPAVGDVLTFKVDGNQFHSITFTAAEATDTASIAIAATSTTGASATAANDDGNAITAAWVAAAKTITLTTADSGTQVITDAVVTRGTHAPVAGSDITTSAFAATALGVLDTAIEGVNSTRAGLGASMSRLEYASDNLQNVSQNTSAALRRVLDADYAAETTELARTQIIQQASTAMLSQANQAQQSVLALLK
jgi:flagellin